MTIALDFSFYWLLILIIFESWLIFYPQWIFRIIGFFNCLNKIEHYIKSISWFNTQMKVCIVKSYLYIIDENNT